MKRTTLTLLIIAFLYSCSNAQPTDIKTKMQWNSFETAIELNKENHKKIFVDIYTEWCGWCKKMNNLTFANKEIAKYMNEYFYAVKFDAETMDTISFMGKDFVNISLEGKRKSSHQLAQALLKGKMSYPSYAFLNEKNQMLTVVKGFIGASDFEPIINYFGEDAFKTTKWDEYSSKFVSKLK